MPMKKLNNQKIDFHFFDQKVLIPPLKGHCVANASGSESLQTFKNILALKS